MPSRISTAAAIAKSQMSAVRCAGHFSVISPHVSLGFVTVHTVPTGGVHTQKGDAEMRSHILHSHNPHPTEPQQSCSLARPDPDPPALLCPSLSPSSACTESRASPSP